MRDEWEIILMGEWVIRDGDVFVPDPDGVDLFIRVARVDDDRVAKHLVRLHNNWVEDYHLEF